MIRLLVLLALGVLAWRYFSGRWPWQHARLRQGTSDAADRRLLGLPPRPTRQQINEAHRRLLAQNHPDRGGDPARAQALNAARDRLLAGTQPLSEEP